MLRFAQMMCGRAAMMWASPNDVALCAKERKSLAIFKDLIKK